jgi:hypothetical protein
MAAFRSYVRRTWMGMGMACKSKRVPVRDDEKIAIAFFHRTFGDPRASVLDNVPGFDSGAGLVIFCVTASSTTECKPGFGFWDCTWSNPV